MKLYPESALIQLELDKIQQLLIEKCSTEYAIGKASQLRIHTQFNYIDTELRQTHEFKVLILSGQYFPNDFRQNIAKEIKLLSIPGAVFNGEQFTFLRKLLENMQSIFRWFDKDHRESNPFLTKVIDNSYYEKTIMEMINDIIDEYGVVKDNASEELYRIRMSLYRKRNELRRVFDKLIQKMNKNGYLADMEESFMNGRRVLAVVAENKRIIKGIIHGESDSRQTTYIEPEETTGLSNEIMSLESEEAKEVYRIFRQLTANIHPYHALLKNYYEIVGEFDFIKAKARLAVEMSANMPQLTNQAHVELVEAYHPLLFLYNLRQNKKTIPLDIHLDEKNRILVISGPNAGGKTVTMKTIGLCQLMMQAGLLIPVSGLSKLGIFKQLYIHIGDTQSIEFELSTYSSHLKHMKHFIETANGKTLFFIDELGSGRDPNLGGAFAEVIMEELGKKRSFGVVTTHYLNLKVMANRVPGIINGAMQFNEQTLSPLYKLVVGKPGSSYTFSIAERIGLPKQLIDRAHKLVDENQYKLDKLLNKTEQDLQRLEGRESALEKQVRENDRLKRELEKLLDKEKHRQQIELLKHQNKHTDEQLLFLKDMERKLKAMIVEWRKSENKNEVIQNIQWLLFDRKEKPKVQIKKDKKFDEKYIEVEGEIAEGDMVKLIKNRQVGTVNTIRGKKAVVQIGAIPITTDLSDMVKVVEREISK